MMFSKLGLGAFLTNPLAPARPTPSIIGSEAIAMKDIIPDVLHPASETLAAAENVVTPDTERLVRKYPASLSDFYPSLAPCIFKTGPTWPPNPREARPVYGHPIGPTWRAIGRRIYEEGLDAKGVNWTSVNPLAYAHAGQAVPFCPLLILVSVTPHSLTYEGAVIAAKGVKDILSQEGFPDVEVAFVEMVLAQSVAGPELLPFRPLPESTRNLRNPFTPTLGLAIAPLKTPYLEGTGGLYFRLGGADNRVVLLTCAHVARPPPAFPANTGMTRKRNSQRCEEIIMLGERAYRDAIRAMKHEVEAQAGSIERLNSEIHRIADPERIEVFLRQVDDCTTQITRVNELHEEVTKRHKAVARRVIGSLLHSEPLRVSVGDEGFTEDWALIELYPKKFDWSRFTGNTVYVGGGRSSFAELMFHPLDQAGYTVPKDGLLQAYGMVQDDEIRYPQHLDIHGQKCLLVVKNGMATGLTAGRVNGLESFTRVIDIYGINQTSIEIAVLGYSKHHGTFSARGDSGSAVLARDGRIVGIITGGVGLTENTDITYLTPFWWLLKRIQAKFPGISLYPVVR